MKTKVIFLLLFPLVAQMIVSCCDCEDTVTFRYTNKSITVVNLDNSSSKPIVATGTGINKNAYGIRLQLTREKTACHKVAPSYFISSAYAFKCGCPPLKEFLPRDSIVSIRIFTLLNFDNTHPANSELSTYFKVFSPYTFTTITDYFKNKSLILYDESEMEQKLDLLLMTPPAVSGQYSFKVQFNLSDGRALEATTTQINLL